MSRTSVMEFFFSNACNLSNERIHRICFRGNFRKFLAQAFVERLKYLKGVYSGIKYLSYSVFSLP